MNRTRPSIAICVAATVLGPLVAPAPAQSLAERIEAVRQRRAEEEAQAAAKRQTVDQQTQMLQRLYHGRLSVDFRETPARDALDYIKTTLGINLIARYNDEATGVGIDPEALITLELDDVPSLEVLQLVLEQCAGVNGQDATWQVRNGFIEVGTKDRLSAAPARYTVVYDVDDLLYEVPKFDDAPQIQLDEIYRNYPYGYAPYLVGGPYPPAGPFVSGHSISGAIGGPSTSLGPGPGNTTGERDARGQELADHVTMIVEPDAWERNGGTWASIRYTQGVLIVNAPEFIQRQIGGSRPVPKP